MKRPACINRLGHRKYASQKFRISQEKSFIYDHYSRKTYVAKRVFQRKLVKKLSSFCGKRKIHGIVVNPIPPEAVAQRTFTSSRRLSFERAARRGGPGVTAISFFFRSTCLRRPKLSAGAVAQPAEPKGWDSCFRLYRPCGIEYLGFTIGWVHHHHNNNLLRPLSLLRKTARFPAWPLLIHHQ